jgi:hypothetical protein
MQVHIKEKVFLVNCGEGSQRVRWLGDVAIYRYDDWVGMHTGIFLSFKNHAFYSFFSPKEPQRA